MPAFTGRGGADPFGEFEAGDIDHRALDAALRRLEGPTTLEDRLGVLRRLVEYWHGPIGPEDGIPDAALSGIPMPDALRWWYRWAGKRTEIMTGQNILHGPRHEDRGPALEVCDGKLRFYVENQWVYEWATLPQGEDPPVFGRYESGDPWEEEGLRVSEHLILACIFEAVMCHARYGASRAWLPPEEFGRLSSLIPPIGIGAWRWAEGLRAYAKNGAFMCAGGSDKAGGYSVWIGARTEHPLAFLKPLVDEKWEYVAL